MELCQPESRDELVAYFPLVQNRSISRTPKELYLYASHLIYYDLDFLFMSGSYLQVVYGWRNQCILVGQDSVL